jgi:hypothetical protein
MSWWNRKPAAQVETDNDDVEMPPAPGATLPTGVLTAGVLTAGVLTAGTSAVLTHPSLAILQAEGINSAEQLTAIIASAKAFKSQQATALAKLRTDAKAKAIAAYGQEKGAKYATALDTFDVAALELFMDAADSVTAQTFGYDKDGKPKPRASAPVTIVSGVVIESEQLKTAPPIRTAAEIYETYNAPAK